MLEGVSEACSPAEDFSSKFCRAAVRDLIKLRAAARRAG